MKTLIYSIFATVIGGIILFVAQPYLQNKPLVENRQLNYTVEDLDIKLNKDNLSEISKGLSDIFPDDVQFAIIKIQNSGNQPLPDQEASVRVGQIGEGEQTLESRDKIFKLATVQFPGRDPDAVSIKLKDNKASVKYKLLNPGETHEFWIAYRAIGNTVVISRGAGVAFRQGEPEGAETVDRSYSIIWLFLGALGAIFVGSAITFGAISSELGKRGQNLEQLLKLPKV